MNAVISQMLEKYQVGNLYDRKNAMKEILQEIALCGLSRAGFFRDVAFYGGTALRIFYGLDRFSEDLDFSLEAPDISFDISKYFPILEKEVNSFGINVSISEKKKSADSNIQSAFLKGNTREHLLLFFEDEDAVGEVAKNEIIKIKFEVDINPPAYAGFENKYRLLPVPYEVKMYDLPSLFAGKIHAVLCRAWKNRTKGRDLYDFVFYLSRGVHVNLKHLRERLIQTQAMPDNFNCTIDEIKELLIERFEKIDYKQAKQDVEPFVQDTAALNIWCADFFKQITEALKAD